MNGEANYLHNQDARGKKLWLALAFAAVLLVDGLLLSLLFRQMTGELIAAVVVVTGILVVTPRLFDIGSLDVGPGGIKATLNRLEKQAAKQERDIGRLFAMAMGEPMYQNLKRLQDGAFEYEWSDGLERELYHLRDIGYIKIDGGIRQLPRHGEDLSQSVHITDRGRDFVRLREFYEKGAQESS